MKQVAYAQKQQDPAGGSSAPQEAVTVQIEEPAPRRSTSLPLSPALRAQQAQRLKARLRPYLKGTLQLTITDNKSVMISVQRDPKHARYDVRLHHLFVDAPDSLMQALSKYIVVNDRQASQQLNKYIEANQHRIRSSAEVARPSTIRTRGRHFDLAAIFNELNAQYFEYRACCQITWGRHVSRGKSRRSIKVGSFSLEESLIRIHPGLDQAWIPRYYIEWVVYHEMLHSLYPIPIINGRHSFHTPEFAKDERLFAAYQQAIDWERRNLAALLCI